MDSYNPAKTNIPEITYRLNCVKEKLEIITDDTDRREIYDLLDEQVDILDDVIEGLTRINRTLRAISV